MSRRRHRRYDRSREYNNRAERRRGMRVRVSVDGVDVFVGRMRGFKSWRAANEKIVAEREGKEL